MNMGCSLLLILFWMFIFVFEKKKKKKSKSNMHIINMHIRTVYSSSSLLLHPEYTRLSELYDSNSIWVLPVAGTH